MGRRGRKPQYAKREAFAKLIAEGVPSARACRMVGVCRRTGTRWRNGRRITSGGRVLNLPPVITVSPNPEKRYAPRYLSEDERVRLADLRRERRTMREIGALMGRSPSTISRELARGADAAGRYRPFEAHRRALGRRRLHRPSRLARDAILRDWVADRLKARWSPEQFPGAAPPVPRRAGAVALCRDDLPGRLSAGSRRPAERAAGRVLHLRRRGRLARRHVQARRSGPLTGVNPIGERPAAVLDRVEPGHWEGDLITGAGNASAIVTMVERVTRATFLGHLPGPRHDAASVRDVVVAALSVLPSHLRRTLTWDQGSEMARHTEITTALGTEIYFCDPHAPWQRPSNENTNGLLRAYFPKSTDLSVFTADDIARVQAELNGRPRKVLGWDSPAERLTALLGSPAPPER